MKSINRHLYSERIRKPSRVVPHAGLGLQRRDNIEDNAHLTISSKPATKLPLSQEPCIKPRSKAIKRKTVTLRHHTAQRAGLRYEV